MKLLRKRDIPEERYTNAFLGYGPEDSHFVVELTYSKLLQSKCCYHMFIPHIVCVICCIRARPLMYIYWQIMVWKVMISELLSVTSGLLSRT